MNARAHATRCSGRRGRVRAHALWLVSLASVVLATAAPARAQLDEQTATERKEEAQAFEERRETWTLGGHSFVAPLSLESVPFEFALPLAQLDSRTQIGVAWVDGERNEGQLLGTTHYALATQTYDLSLRFWKRFETALAIEGEAASGLDGDAIVAGGLGAAGGARLSFGYQLVKLERIALLARLGARMDFGYRANIQPLLYQVQAMPLDLLEHFDFALVGSPSSEGAVSLGLGSAIAWSRSVSLQVSARGERIATLVEPWLRAQGSQAEGPRELGYQGWAWSAAAALGLYWGEVLLQPQFGVGYRGESLQSPRQQRGPDSHAWSLVPAVEVMFLASPVLQMGGGLGAEIAWGEIEDVYNNTYSTDSVMPFAQLIARYIWGQSWPGH